MKNRETCSPKDARFAKVGLGLPDLGISNLDDVLTDVQRITNVSELPLLAY